MSIGESLDKVFVHGGMIGQEPGGSGVFQNGFRPFSMLFGIAGSGASQLQREVRRFEGRTCDGLDCISKRLDL